MYPMGKESNQQGFEVCAPSLPIKYLLRFNVGSVCFWGPVIITSSRLVFGSLWGDVFFSLGFVANLRCVEQGPKI